jgi:FKBP-type peptidyl-prolyl cis-trans isomerase FkpA
MRNSVILMAIFMLFLCCSCARKKERTYTAKEIKATEEALIGANKILVKKDEEKIREYARKYRLAMQETPSGLWYKISGTGSGAKAQKGQKVTLRYKVSLLDGTLCYNSDYLGLKQFRVGQGGVESGLEEGVMLLSVGNQATFIMPPHLAHGLPGDGEKIPARSIIVYEVELLKLEP